MLSCKWCNSSDEGDEILGIRLRVSEDDKDHRILIVIDNWIISEHLTVGLERCVDVVLIAESVLACQHACLVDALLSLTVWRRVLVRSRVPPFLRKVHSLPVDHRCTSTPFTSSPRRFVMQNSFTTCIVSTNQCSLIADFRPEGRIANEMQVK